MDGKDLNDVKELKATLLAGEIRKEDERKNRGAEEEEDEERQRKALEEIKLKRNKQKTCRQPLLLSSDIASLHKALQDAIRIGAPLPEVDQARERLEALKNSQEALKQSVASRYQSVGGQSRIWYQRNGPSDFGDSLSAAEMD